MNDRYEMVVGLEVHVQLKTRTKAFCGCSTDFGAPPNQNTCPVCLALPGTLPVLNAEAVELAVRAALGLGCHVHHRSVFARKNYFYPDLPKGYQISQFDQPLATQGKLAVARSDGSLLEVGITRLHLEEDAGKSIHDRYPGRTAVDLNRCGVPLIEIVSEPDMRTPEEAGAYLRELKRIMEYLEVSDANMEEGSLRVDANISVRPRGSSRLGTKTEIKNMNSFANVERALATEFQRQVTLLESGGRVVQQTMLWDAQRGEVRPARSKEESHDYRYFPEPDLPPLVLEDAWVSAIRASLPELPAAKRQRFARQYSLPSYDIEVLTASRKLADYFEATAAAHGDAKAAANWIMGELLAQLNSRGLALEELSVPPSRLAALLDLVRSGTVSHSAAKRIFALMIEGGEEPSVIAEREGLLQVGDETQLLAWIDEVFAENPEEARRFAAGERKLLGVLVGLVMKKSKGRADPRKVNQLIAARLSV
ncbi:MAG TPA: Asp-tRNA(Asn)/Glu-tRNA(Gln) amidotransferase subunit GatB [Gemmatimonadaceae bacterium]|nr:Asp-tRNA(Asn)/Glu-tRNA(Gln) amidotransferase subunit GatB [Gemmatimonadaceae bacterium]